MAHLSLSMTLLAALCVGAGNIAGAHGRPVVLELFTSEGCSSCPPAELIVNELARRPDVLALAFHVDYWDGLGWRDRFSFAAATERQRRYARSLRQSSVYTPQAVVDGSRDVVGSQRDALIQAIAGPREGVEISVSVESQRLRVHVGTGSAGSAADVLLVSYLREATTHIGRGENSGRTLVESNVVRGLQVLGRWSGNPHDFELDPATLPAGVTDVAVLLQSTGQGAILGAATHAVGETRDPQAVPSGE